MRHPARRFADDINFGLIHTCFNDDQNPGKDANGTHWRYCKVGMTEVDTTTGSHNRMERVMEEIEHRTGKDTSVIFVVPMKATDSRPNTEIEKYVRKCVGNEVDKEVARNHNFPVPTEWVLTTQSHLEKIMSKIADTAFVDTGLFANLKFNP